MGWVRRYTHVILALKSLRQEDYQVIEQGKKKKKKPKTTNNNNKKKNKRSHGL